MRFKQIRSRLHATVVFTCLCAILCQTLPVLAATAPSKVVIAHAGMNARTVVLWTAQEQKFLPSTVPTRRSFLSARRRCSWPA